MTSLEGGDQGVGTIIIEAKVVILILNINIFVMIIDHPYKTWVTSLVGGGQGVGTSREESRVRDPRGLLVEPVVSQEFWKKEDCD